MVAFLEGLMGLGPHILVASVIWMIILKKYVKLPTMICIIGGFALGISTPWSINTIFG